MNLTTKRDAERTAKKLIKIIFSNIEEGELKNNLPMEEFHWNERDFKKVSDYFYNKGKLKLYRMVRHAYANMIMADIIYP